MFPYNLYDEQVSIVHGVSMKVGLPTSFGRNPLSVNNFITMLCQQVHYYVVYYKYRTVPLTQVLRKANISTLLQ